MPRLPNSILRRAYHVDPLLPLLLRPCRDLSSAQNELRWLREHVLSTSTATAKSPQGLTPVSFRALYKLCLERARGKPLQYILGSQPFGELDILCRPGVLIPSLSILGIDISLTALKLAGENLARNTRLGHLHPTVAHQLHFAHGDVLTATPSIEGEWDILISNPPYISSASFDTDTERSVRNYEPKLALVPPPPHGASKRPLSSGPDVAGDTFYEPLDRLARKAKAKIMVLEVAGTEQAMRVIQGIYKGEDGYWDGCEVWHDDWDGRRSDEGAEGLRLRHLGTGHGRAVVCWRGEGREWLHGRRAARV
ncbi:hypothetical protein MMC11_003857 [Xylographa trunciseda]|nr:hypothetical protein [Xylographa trunciseda]